MLTQDQGGASNLAVIISVTVKAYETLPYTELNFSYNTTAKSDTFWSAAAYFHSQIPRMAKSGLMGYFYVTPLDATENDESMQGKIYGTWLAPKLNLAAAKEILTPLEHHLNSARWGDPVFAGSIGQEHPSYTKGFAETNQAESAGVEIRLGSRLLDEKALSKPLPELKQALRTANGDWITLGHVVAGPGTRDPPGGIAGGSNAVLPAWRKACLHQG